MDSQLQAFLKSKYSSDTFHTHVSMIDPKGKISLNREDLEQFWDLYCDLFSQNFNGTVSGVAEKPQKFVPVLVDIDIKIKGSSHTELYNQEQVLTLIQIYQSVLRVIIDDCEDHHLVCLFLSKSPYLIRKSEGETYVKHGFHLHFPNIFLSQSDHSNHLLPRIKEQVKSSGLFRNLVEDSSELVDSSYFKVPWLLYGSRKKDKLQSYRFAKAFNASSIEVSLDEALAEHVIYDKDEVPLRYERHIEYYLPRILSIIPYGRAVNSIKETLAIPGISRTLEAPRRRQRKYSDMSISESLQQAQRLLPLLGDERSRDRNEWVKVGWILYNISYDGSDEDREEAYSLWVEFSRRCPENFNEAVCAEEWKRMVKKELNIGTLKWLASFDSPEAYEKFKEEASKAHRESSVKAGCHNDIAKALYEEYGNIFVCASISQHIWYGFGKHFWKKSDGGVDLRRIISGIFAKRYIDEEIKLARRLGEIDDDDDKDRIIKKKDKLARIVAGLKSHPFKNNVMKECEEVFYDSMFLKKLDSDPYLIGFRNGVYDLKANVFRDGQPEDFVSMRMGIEYKEFGASDPKVLGVWRFLEQIFPDTSVRDYFVNVTSEVFVGGNQNKLVHFWSGEGDNGKSITEMIVEQMFGEYAVKLPTSLITGKRTQSSAACPELVRAGSGVRWAVLQEPDQKDSINIGILKELSGNDTFYARGLFKDGGEITPMFKLVLICNEPPKLPYSDRATRNRIRVIPYEATFDEPENVPETYEEQLMEKRFSKDPYFADKIPDMLEAFCWILLSHRKTSRRVLFEPEKVKIATIAYIRKNDTYRQFAEECIAEDAEGSLTLHEVYQAFKDWFRESMPNHTMPIKNDLKDYFTRYWEPLDRGKWHGYKVKGFEQEEIPLDDADFEGGTPPENLDELPRLLS